MSKKILFKYIIIYLPVILGGSLLLIGIKNIFSYLLLFGGGYIAIKNTLDFRVAKRNINKMNNSYNVEVKKNGVEKKDNKQKVMNCENVSSIKRNRVYTRVRKKY